MNLIPYENTNAEQHGFSIISTIGLIFIALLFSKLFPRIIGEIIIPFFTNSESKSFKEIGYPIISELSLIFIPYFALNFYNSYDEIYEIANAVPNNYKKAFCFILCFTMISISLITEDKCYNTQIQNSDNLFYFILYMFIDCILPSFCEEFVFRGWTFHFLNKKMNHFLAIIITSFLFTLCHPFKSWFSYLLIFLLSSCWNYANILVDSIFVSIFSHFFHNFSQSLMLVIIPSACNISSAFSFALWLISSLILFLLFNNIGISDQAENNNSSEAYLEETAFLQ